MAGLLPFFIIIAASLAFSESFKRLHLPYVTALITAGILLGPSYFNVIVIDESISLLGAIGVVFLMFIAGSEVKSGSFKSMRKEAFVFASFNGFIPFFTGFAISWLFGFGMFPSLVLGIVFISSSMAVIIPSLESNNLMHTKLGRLLITSTVFEDIGSLLLLSFILQSFTQQTPLPLPLYMVLVVALILVLKLVVPKIGELYYFEKRGKDLFESELRFVLVVMIATVIMFETLGMHSILAGFIIGIILSDSIRGKVEEKIRTVSYGLFIPTFFLIIGVQTDLSVFTSLSSALLIATVVFGLLASKILSGWLAAHWMGFSSREGLLMGVSTIPQLSTTLAAAFAAREFGLLQGAEQLITTLVILSIVTTFIAPLAVGFLNPQAKPEKKR